MLARAGADELAAAGGRRRRKKPATVLSVQQRRVAELAVTGATAREIAASPYVSAKTVESHLAAVYMKLGVSGKAELRKRRDLLTSTAADSDTGPAELTGE